MSTPVGYQILLALSMQMFGLGLAGLAYKYIVEPPQMVTCMKLADKYKLTQILDLAIDTCKLCLV